MAPVGRDRGAGEPFDGRDVTDRVAGLGELTGDLVGVNRVLGVDGVSAPLTLAGGVPFLVQLLLMFLADLGEQGQLLGEAEVVAATGNDAFENCVGDLAGIGWHRDRDAELAADALVLSQQHLEHDAVDRAVRRIESDRPHGVAFLAEAVNPALPLLVTRRVPREVVVDDRVKAILEVDSLAEAVGGDEHALIV